MELRLQISKTGGNLDVDRSLWEWGWEKDFIPRGGCRSCPPKVDILMW